MLKSTDHNSSKIQQQYRLRQRFCFLRPSFSLIWGFKCTDVWGCFLLEPTSNSKEQQAQWQQAGNSKEWHRPHLKHYSVLIKLYKTQSTLVCLLTERCLPDFSHFKVQILKTNVSSRQVNPTISSKQGIAMCMWLCFWLIHFHLYIFLQNPQLSNLGQRTCTRLYKIHQKDYANVSAKPPSDSGLHPLYQWRDEASRYELLQCPMSNHSGSYLASVYLSTPIDSP